MFSKILIANRGEIACRVASTAKKMGVRTVAVYSDADRHAKHVSVCDEAVYLGGSAPKDSYLLGDKLIQIAKDTGAEAIHPGYGFLSENDKFATACEEAGIEFIGPPASAITEMGLKSESKRLMETAGVPLIPGYHGENQDPEFLRGEADRIDYPVLIKASSGGGGKGMRLVTKSEDFIELLASCKREAITSFGDDKVLIEKYALNPRHIEIQVFGDKHGNYVSLFERDCSVQRRHQKVLEEAPAPGVDEAMRNAMGTAAINAARACNYAGAGTVEFIVEQRPNPNSAEGKLEMSFFFMEMNTRLQVEHPVTEAITGVDLVEWQLRVASGEKLPKTQDELSINGHAIEARICAENPDNDFLPATGTLAVYRKPDHAVFELGSVRVDDGVREGDDISPYYDSMIAKLIVHSSSRKQALSKLDSALSETRIVGLPNNVAFIRHILATESFSVPNLDTALIEREKENLFDHADFSLPVLVATAVINQLTKEAADLSNTNANNDPFALTNGWRAYTEYRRSFHLTNVQNEGAYIAKLSNWQGQGTDKQGFDLVIQPDVANAPELEVNDAEEILYQGHISFINEPVSHSKSPMNNAEFSDTHTLWLDGRRQQVQVWEHKEDVYIFADNGSGVIHLIDEMLHVGEEQEAAGSLKSPMPGQVVGFKVAVGDTVKKGDALAVIEAMKIEHTINAPADGVVAELLFSAGDQVADGDELLRIDTGE